MSVLLVSRRPELLARLEPALHAEERATAETLMPRAQLVVLDLRLRDSWLLLARSPRPVLALAADPEQVVRALDSGAEDAVLVDTPTPELQARIRAILRRHQLSSRVLLESRRALVDGRPLELSTKEAEVLGLLVGSPGRSFSREELLRLIWGATEGETRRVDLVVSKLRRKLAKMVREPLLHSVWGVGYRYEE